MRVRFFALFLGLGLSPVFHCAATDTTYVRFNTALGNIDVQMLSDEAPLNVANFLSYVDSGAYTNSVVHRSEPGFIWQGGSFLRELNTNTLTPTSILQPIATGTSVVNEYGTPNTAGTLAMAKLANQPDSATSGWFFNDVDNTTTLGPSNDGGFTVVGRVADGASLAVMNRIAVIQPPNPAILGEELSEAPLLNYTAGNDVTLANLLGVNSITRVTLQPLSTWTSAKFTSTQQQNAGFIAPDATPFNDGVPNLLKYFYDIDPSRTMTAADRTALPVFGTTVSGGANFLTMIYRQSTSETGLTVVVQTSPDLQTWTTSVVTPIQIGTFSPSGDLQMEVAVQSSSTVKFLRLQVTGG